MDGDKIMCCPLRRCQSSSSKPSQNDGERLRQAVIAELNRKIQNLRLKGDHYRATKLERFKRVFFEEPDRNFEVLPDGTVRFKDSRSDVHDQED